MRRQCYNVVLIVVAMLFNSNPGSAQSLQADAPVPYRSITTQEESTIEKTATLALRQISQARSDIHRKDFAVARRDLAEAVKLMKVLRDNLSTAPTKNLITIARRHLEYEPAQQVAKEFPTLYASLEAISVYLPTDKATLHIDRAKAMLEKQDKRGADRELALADKSLIVIEVEIPLLKAEQYATKAQGYLAVKDAKNADHALQIAEQRARAIYAGTKTPLFLAKQNMWLAFRNYSSSSRAETESYLAQARTYLGKAEMEGSAITKAEAGKLRHDIEGLSKRLPVEGKGVESTLKAAWKRSEAIAERSLAYYAAGLSEAETTLSAETNLIEAKLHVAFAETYQVTTAEPDSAVRELDKAAAYLQKAAESDLAGPADRTSIRRISDILQVLKVTPGKNDAVIQGKYETVKEGLSDLIRKM